MPDPRVFCFDAGFLFGRRPRKRKLRNDRAPATLNRGEASMLDADFWLDQAMMFRRQATAVRDLEERDELCALAQICDAVATKMEEHTSGG